MKKNSKSLMIIKYNEYEMKNKKAYAFSYIANCDKMNTIF